jgi:zinc protease
MHRKTRRLTFAVLALAAPGLAAAAELKDIPYELFRLKNGLTVIVHEDHSAPIATVNTWYHVGSGRERPGRTGFAHLFEHIMFEGSKNVPEGMFDRWLEAVGGDNNGSTSNDRTNYYENVPSNAIEVPLFLESDRMGSLLDAMSPAKVDGQRDIVKNERRQSYENRPYGMAELALIEALYPKGHPYSWPVIGSMEDLSAASYEDVVEFFKRWYGPGNAVVSIAGDVTVAEARALAEKWFGDIPATAPVDPLAAQPVALKEEKRVVLEDRVQLPRLYLQWPTPPYLSPADAPLDALASVLAAGKTSRLYRRLVYELQVAQDVTAYQQSAALASTFDIVATARAGRTLEEIRALVDAEIARLRQEPPTERELSRVKNQAEATLLSRLEQVGGFGGKADLLNSYYFAAGNPGYFQEDLARTSALSPADVRAVAQRYLGEGRVVLSVVPTGKKELAVPEVRR